MNRSSGIGSGARNAHTLASWAAAGSSAIEPVGGQPGRGGQRPRVGRSGRGLVQQLPGLGPQQVQVLGGRRAGLGHEPGGLRHGQRQVPQLGGEPVRISRAEPGHPVLQEGHRFGAGQHVDLDRRGDLGPGPLRGR